MNSTRVLVTNGGPHPAHELAMVSAEQIASHDILTPEKRFAAERLKLDIAETLTHFHELNQAAMRNALQMDCTLPGEEQLNILAEMANARVQAAAINTPWEQHYQLPAVRKVVTDTLKRHFALALKIEQDWHKVRTEGRT